MDTVEGIDIYDICGEWVCTHTHDLRDGEERSGNHIYEFIYDGTFWITVVDRPWQEKDPGEWRFDGNILFITLFAGMTLKYYYAIERLHSNELMIDQLCGIKPDPAERFIRKVFARR